MKANADSKYQMGTRTSEKPHTTPLLTVTLQTLLEAFKAPRVIDYFSLDIEGTILLSDNCSGNRSQLKLSLTSQEESSTR